MSASLSLTLRRTCGPSLAVVAYTGTAGTSTKLPQQANTVMVWCDTAAYVRVGPGSDSAITTVATSADIPLPANLPVVLTVPAPTAGGSANVMYVSAVRISASGNMYVQPLVD